MTATKESIGKALGRISGGLYIVNCKDGDKKAGFLASWVQQAGFEPPMISVAIKKGRFHLDAIRHHKKFTLNVMSKENGKTMSAFFKAPPEGKCIYDDLDTFTALNGIETLKDSVSYLECEYKSEIESGDHVIILAEITAGDMLLADLQPASHLRASGFDY